MLVVLIAVLVLIAVKAVPMLIAVLVLIAANVDRCAMHWAALGVIGIMCGYISHALHCDAKKRLCAKPGCEGLTNK